MGLAQAKLLIEAPVNGGLSRKNGDHFRKTLLSRGGTAEAMDLFRNFRGRDPIIEPLLERRGLTAQ